MRIASKVSHRAGAELYDLTHAVGNQPNSVLIVLLAMLAAVSLLVGCSRDIGEPARTAAQATGRIAAAAHADAGQSGNAVTVAATAAGDTTLAGAAVQASGADTAGVHAIPVALVAAANAPVVPKLSAPLSFSLKAKALAKEMKLQGEAPSSAVGFLCMGGSAAAAVAGQRGDLSMRVSRFAQYGHTDTLFLFQWVVAMENDQGNLTARRVTQNGKKGFEVTLEGKLFLNVLMKTATEPMRMQTRNNVTLTGFSKSWPPYGAVLTLKNGPANFYFDKVVNDTSAPPMVVVSEAQAAIGDGPSNYFESAPHITKAQLVGPSGTPWKRGEVGGVHLEWTPIGSASVPVPIAGYNVYRSASGTGGWRRIATLPATATSFEDTGFNGRESAAYIVTHRTQFPISYEYEGTSAAPAFVKAVQ